MTRIGGDMAALARLHFTVLDAEQQEQAIRRMAVSGHGPQTIAQATGLSIECIARLLRPLETSPNARRASL